MSIRATMTYDMPKSLQQCCLDFICNNLDVLCQEIPLPRSINVKLAFKNSDVFLTDAISEEFLKTLCEKKKLNDETFALFDSKFMNLKKVYIKDAQLSAAGLRILKAQKIVALEVSGLGNVTVNDVIGSLGQWTLNNLKTLHVSNLKSINNPNKMGVGSYLNTTDLYVNIGSLRSLKYLDISNTELNLFGLNIIANQLPCLEVLNISCTRISEISPLRRCRDRLKCLSMYNLNIGSDSIPVLTQLTGLVHLDMSYDSHSINLFEINLNRFRFKVSDLLSRTHCLPNLTSLDISGNEGLNEPDLMQFLKSHSNIQFLGLALTPACIYPLFLGDKDSELKTNITVTGEANERQLLECLRRYANRPTYVNHTLFKLCDVTSKMTEPREDILKLLLMVIKQNPNHNVIQARALSCILNLLRTEQRLNVHPSCLKDIVCHTVRAMENFPKNQQSNPYMTVITICDIDKVATLIMDCICFCAAPTTLFRCLDMLEILSAMMSTDLGSDSRYMKQLLQLLDHSAVHERMNITVDAILIALGNFTAHSPLACQVLVAEGGLDTFMRMQYIRHYNVQGNILGIIMFKYNIVQSERLRRQLLRPDLLLLFKDFLNAQLLVLRHLAAAIVAYLASDEENKRFVEEVEPYMLDNLKAVILSWEQPEKQIFDCRYFKDFLPLLHCTDTPAAQLWALWSIQHICIQSGALRCQKLEEDGVLTLLIRLAEDSQTDHDVVKIIKNILQLTEQNMQ
ncbi:hypothetical protein ACJMK2_038714 [Sinanodonta woodiana]|uniref:Uncharacterized protein n=1 Tax=Sinanodonta woodiana TaxID=1069815 RepID=A0ABD3W9V0_SINWO